ncbi:hypothetical protein I4P27_17975 [Enterobacter roggenkampii]|nr:hypothetical protein [Enterobacter roggenkampii]
MIRINREFDQDIKKSFSKIVQQLNKIVKTKKTRTTITEELNFLNTIDKKTIRKLVFSKPKRLKNIVLKIYNEHPLVCEFYSPDYFFRKLNLTLTTNLQLPLTNKENKSLVYQELCNAIQIISIFSQTNSSLIVRDILSTSYTETKMSALRNKILDLIKIKNGSPLNKDTISLFPSWICSIQNIFNYSLIDRDTAYQLNRFLDIYACPYCNSENIEPIIDEAGTDYRPAFDHFIPKYKYPLISFSLFNLIPSCGKCNSTYKKTLDPIMTPFSNPFIEGVNDTQLFMFNYDLNYIYRDGNISDDNIVVVLINQNSNIDRNMTEFSIRARYNAYNTKKIARAIAKQAFDLNSLENNLDSEPSLFASFAYEVNVEPLKQMHKKFMQDAILTFANKRVPLI